MFLDIQNKDQDTVSKQICASLCIEVILNRVYENIDI